MKINIKVFGAKVKHYLKKNAPEILLGVGIVSMGGAVVSSAIAARNLDDILDEHESKLEQAKSQDKTDKEINHDIRIIYAKTTGKIALRFAPTMAFMGVSTASFISMHNIQAGRIARLSGALTGLKTTFDTYRERNIELNGKEADELCMKGYKKVDVIDEDGHTVGEANVPKNAEDFAIKERANGIIFFNSQTSGAFHGIKSLDWTTLSSCQNILRDRAISGLEPVLNDMYDLLSMERTADGMVWGWDKDHLPELGFEDPCNNAFMNGVRYTNIILTPNAVVNIYDKRRSVSKKEQVTV